MQKLSNKSIPCTACRHRQTVTYKAGAAMLEWVCWICRFINKIKIKK